VTDKNHADETVLTIVQGKGTLPREQAGRNIHYDNASLSNYKMVQKGDFIIHLRSFEGGLEIANENGIVSPAYTILRGKKPHSGRFYEAYFHTDEFINHVLSKSVEGIRDGRQISYDAFKWLSIPYCNPNEQEKIADLFSTLSRRIEKQSALVDSLKKYKRGVISVLLSSRNNPYYSSVTWKEVALCDVASGFEYGMNAAATVYDGSHKYIRITDIDDNSHLYSQNVPVSPEGQVDEKYRVRENDILFARTGASVGKSYRYQRSDGDLYYAGFLIRIHVNSDVNCDYVFQNTLTEAYRRWVLLESARSGQPGINAEQYKQYRFLLPPLELQNKISTLATNLDNLICKEENLLSQIEQVKIALLQRLFI
jgi:type I restriction enzyme S subunit